MQLLASIASSNPPLHYNFVIVLLVGCWSCLVTVNSLPNNRQLTSDKEILP